MRDITVFYCDRIEASREARLNSAFDFFDLDDSGELDEVEQQCPENCRSRETVRHRQYAKP